VESVFLPSNMNIDVHAHYVPADSLKMAGEIGAHHGLKLEKNERRSDYPYYMGEPEPVASLNATKIDPKQISQVAGANACHLLRIGI